MVLAISAILVQHIYLDLHVGSGNICQRGQHNALLMFSCMLLWLI